MSRDEDVREFIRIKKVVPVTWTMTVPSGRTFSGKGRIVDLSFGGLCLEINRPTVQFKEAVFHIEPEDATIDCIPEKADLRWVKTLKVDPNACFCGIQFRHTSKENTKKFYGRFKQWLGEIGGTANINILKNYIERIIKKL